MSRTDFCAATVAKSYEHKLERESCSQRGRLKSAGTKLASCHPIIFSTRKKTEEKRCFESERCFKTIFSSQNMRFLNGICGLIGNPLVRVIRLFLWDFVPSCSGGFFCFLTLVLSKKAGNFSTVSFPTSTENTPVEGHKHICMVVSNILTVALWQGSWEGEGGPCRGRAALL